VRDVLSLADAATRDRNLVARTVSPEAERIADVEDLAVLEHGHVLAEEGAADEAADADVAARDHDTVETNHRERGPNRRRARRPDGQTGDRQSGRRRAAVHVS